MDPPWTHPKPRSAAIRRAGEFVGCRKSPGLPDLLADLEMPPGVGIVESAVGGPVENEDQPDSQQHGKRKGVAKE